MLNPRRRNAASPYVLAKLQLNCLTLVSTTSARPDFWQWPCRESIKLPRSAVLFIRRQIASKALTVSVLYYCRPAPSLDLPKRILVNPDGVMDWKVEWLRTNCIAISQVIEVVSLCREALPLQRPHKWEGDSADPIKEAIGLYSLLGLALH